jgi:putative cardiolipin synthase
MLFWIICAIVLALCLGGAIAVARVIFALPQIANRTDSTVLPPADHGRVAQAIANRAKGHAGASGIALLEEGTDAFAARIALADAAAVSIDEQ